MQNIKSFSIRERLAEAIAPSLRERRDLLEREANTDALTGLANRAAFEKATPKAKRDGLAFVVFDMNNFGKVNKTVGFSDGDKTLQHFANVVSNVAKMFKGRAFRLGGDEFVIICLHRFAFGVRDAVERRGGTVHFSGDCEPFSVSITGEVGYSIEDADSRLQVRKTARKASR